MIRRNTKKIGVHWQRIENTAGLGTPDLNGCYHGRESWIELKVAKGNKVDLSPEQVIWLRKRANNGGSAWILCRKQDKGKDYIRIWRGVKASDVKKIGWECPPDHEFERTFDWCEIVGVLFNRSCYNV